MIPKRKIEIIEFWKTSEPYGFLSNFWYATIMISGKIYLTTEHYFQSQKFVGTEHEYVIINQLTAYEAAKEGRKKHRPLRADWNLIKEEIMLTALRAKFTQHKHLRDMLLATGDAYLVESSPVDSYWGTGPDGTGKNKLGILLMQVREELRYVN